MAIYDNLPVFKASYDLLLDVFDACRKIEREFRYTLGEKLQNEITDLMVFIYRANSSTEKLPMIGQAREAIVKVKLYMRLLHDMKQISSKRFALLCDMAETVAKQLAAWYKSVEGKKSSSDEQQD